MSIVTHKGVSAYVATPSKPTTQGILLFSEWWGLNDQIKKLSDRFAAEGFVVVAPDVYHGKGNELVIAQSFNRRC
jgi:dienelactone hydrolase